MKQFLLIAGAALFLATGFLLGNISRELELENRIQRFIGFSQTNSGAFLRTMRGMDESEIDDFIEQIGSIISKIERNVATENTKAALFALTNLELLDTNRIDLLKERQFQALYEFYAFHHDHKLLDDAIRFPIERLREHLESMSNFRERITNPEWLNTTTFRSSVEEKLISNFR